MNPKTDLPAAGQSAIIALRDVRTSSHLIGDAPARGLLALGVVGLLLLASVGFAVGLNVGLSLWWIALALGIAAAAGGAGAGLAPTVGSLWRSCRWGFALPPLLRALPRGSGGSPRGQPSRTHGTGDASAPPGAPRPPPPVPPWASRGRGGLG